MFSETHGKIKGHVRFCDKHGAHGLLYLCPAYPQGIIDEIAAQSDRYIANLRSKKWCDEQVARGLPAEGVAIFRAMAGIDNDDITA